MTEYGYNQLKIGDHVVIGGRSVDAGVECVVVGKTNRRAIIEKNDKSDFAMPNNWDTKYSLSADKKTRHVSYTILRKIENDISKSKMPQRRKTVIENKEETYSKLAEDMLTKWSALNVYGTFSRSDYDEIIDLLFRGGHAIQNLLSEVKIS